MAQNRRQKLKTLRKMTSVLRFTERGDQKQTDETQTITDTVDVQDSAGLKENIIKNVLKSTLNPSNSKWSHQSAQPIAVTPSMQSQSLITSIDKSPEVASAKNASTDTSIATPPPSKANNLKNNLKGILKGKVEDSLIGDIQSIFKEIKDVASDLLMSDEDRVEKELKDKIDSDKKEEAAKLKKSSSKLDVLENLRNKGQISDADFKKHSKDIHKDLDVPQGDDLSSISDDIRAMRSALEKSVKANEDQVMVVKESELERVAEQKTVETIRENDSKETRDILKEISSHTSEPNNSTTQKDEKGGILDDVKGKFWDKTKGKLGKIAERYIPGASKVATAAGEGVAAAGEAAAAGEGVAAAGEAAAAGEGAAAALASSGLASMLLPVAGVLAAGAVGAGIGTLAYNNSETVRNVSGSLMEGILGPIPDPGELEEKRKASPEYAAMLKRVQEKKAQAVVQEPVTGPTSDSIAAVDKPAVENIPNQPKLADKTESRVQTYADKVAASKVESKAIESSKQNVIITPSQSSNSIAASSIAPRNTENTMQRLQERLYRGSVI